MYAPLTSLLMICAAATFAAGLVAAQRWLVADVVRRFTRLPRFEQALLVVAVCVTTVCAQKSGVEKVEVEGGGGEWVESNISNAEVEEAQRRGEEKSTFQSGSGLQTASAEEYNILVNKAVRIPLPLSVDSSASPSLNNLRVSPKAAVTTNDIARGYAFVEARTNSTVSYAMPTNGVEIGTWGKTGAYQDVVRVCLSTDCTDYHGLEEANATSSAEEGDLRKETRSSSDSSAISEGSVLRAKKTGTAFAFPSGDVCVTSLWAYTWGKVRPRLRDRAHEIVAVGAPMSCVPGKGRLWTATTNGSWVITWESFRAGREIFNAENEESQRRGEEVDQNGSYPSAKQPEGAARRGALNAEETESQRRGEEVATQISEDSSASPSLLNLRVNKNISAQIEFFANGDFITRSNDVERVYRRVNPDDWDDDGLANDEDDDPFVTAETLQFGPNQDLSVVEHEANYCWIDLVVPQANAKVTFVGDGESNLVDPSFIAKAGETNRVTLLIGKPYVATCAFPFEIVGQSSGAIEVSRPDDCHAEICWPVRISSADGSGASFGMTVQPSGLAGTFFWTNSCCGVSEKSDSFSFLCASSSCRCTGCSATGFFRYEGYRIACAGGTCGCLPSGGPPQDPASVSASFSKSAIIFEDEYDNSSTEHVGWRSTETVLRCSASGGGKGGFLYVSFEGADKLVLYGGQSLPYSKALAANETISFTCRYRATKASDAEGDIKVTATFTENETGTKQSAEATATAVQVELMPYFVAPENDCEKRHKCGVYELVNCKQTPSSPVVSWVARSGEMESANRFRCPIRAAVNPLSVLCESVEYVPLMTVVEPNEVVVRDPGWSDLDAPVGEAGSLLMLLPFYIGPLDVSFYGIAVEEVPYDDDPWTGDTHTGYFSRRDLATWWHHTRENGAGEWLDVEDGNRLGGDTAYDNAGITGTLSRVNESGLFVDDPSCRWSDGVINFGIPFGWNKRETSGNATPQARFAENVRAELILQEDGTFTVRKLGNEATRYVDGRVFLNGERKK